MLDLTKNGPYLKDFSPHCSLKLRESPAKCGEFACVACGCRITLYESNDVEENRMIVKV